MACGRTVGKFRFRVVAGSAADTWEPIGQPLVIVGGHVLDYALTVSTLTGGITVAPATALMVAREDQVDAIDVAGGPRATAPGTTHHVTDLTKVGNRFLGASRWWWRVQDPSVTTAMPPARCRSSSSRAKRWSGHVPSRRIPIKPTSGPRSIQSVAVPAAGAESLRAAIVYNSVNDLQHRCSIAANPQERPPSPVRPRWPDSSARPRSQPASDHPVRVVWPAVAPGRSRAAGAFEGIPTRCHGPLARGGRVPGRQDRGRAPDVTIQFVTSLDKGAFATHPAR